MSLKRALVLGAAGLALLAVAAGVRFALTGIPSGTALAAKHLCSLVYVSRLDPDFARAAYIDPFVQPLTSFLRVRYDDAARSVEATGFGVWRAHARFREGLGCTLVHGADDLQDVKLPPIAAAAVALDSAHRSAAFDEAALERALDEVFSDPPGGPPRQTLAAVVLHQGRLVAERYAEGVDATTPLPGWSMAKSVVATLVGTLAYRGQFDVEASGALVEWRRSEDPRAAISMDQLLRMTSGLQITESQSGADPNSEMLFLERDAAAYAAQRPLQAEPGEHWEYMSGNTVLATRVVMEKTGGSLASTVGFMRRELFGPLGMATAVMEPDQAGTPIGSSFMLASARDWARLGQLHLQRGVWRGRRVFAEGWVDYVTRHTPNSGDRNYGSGWWVNSAPEGPRWESLPRDTYAAQGFQHQHIVVVPPHQLVVVRLGATRGDRRYVENLVAGAIAALR
jgi:CubicO group peptidase (beta-lactamase class C family)